MRFAPLTICKESDTLVKRKIITIDEEKCTGCSLCIPNCPEGALQIIDDKARIISDLFCDGLGACIGHCPEDAISIEEREAEEYDERRVMENVVRQGPNVIKAHLEHLKDHGQMEFLHQAVEYLVEQSMDIPIEIESECNEHKEPKLPCGCPGSAVKDLREENTGYPGSAAKDLREETCGCQGSAAVEIENESCCCSEGAPVPKRVSRLGQWPVQIKLVPPHAPYFKGADILLAADCVGFAYPNFHEDFLKGTILLVGCPKLDDADFYTEKIAQIMKLNDIRSLTVLHMEVPCCTGMIHIARTAMEKAGKEIPMRTVQISIRGEIMF